MAPKFRRLATSRDLSRLMTRYYASRKVVGRVRPLAWVTSGAPVEILHAMGVATVYPENYGALVGAQRAAVPLVRVSEEAGYSPDICSYASCHIGSLLDPKRAPQGGLPKPDLLVACNNICGTVIKWYQALAQQLDVPLFLVDAPYQHEPELSSHALHYVIAQMDDLVVWVTRHTGRRLRPEKLRETMALSDEAMRLWQEIRELCTERPSPLNAPDLFLAMAPIVVLRGTRSAVRFYQKLRAEVEKRVACGEGAIAEERYRLLWDNIAIWHRLYQLFSLLAESGACFVVDTYTNAWSIAPGAASSDSARSGLDDLLANLASMYCTVYINQSLEVRADQMAELVDRFAVDGLVFHSNRSCKPYSLGQYELLERVSDRTGVPGLVLEADMCDTRSYAAEPIKNRVHAFLEVLQEGAAPGLRLARE